MSRKSFILMAATLIPISGLSRKVQQKNVNFHGVLHYMKNMTCELIKGCSTQRCTVVYMLYGYHKNYSLGFTAINLITGDTSIKPGIPS